MITQEQLQTWQKLCDEATPGPWHPTNNMSNHLPSGIVGQPYVTHAVTVREGFGRTESSIDWKNNLDFILAAREAVPQLIEELAVYEIAMSILVDEIGGSYMHTDHIKGEVAEALDTARTLVDRLKAPGKLIPLEEVVKKYNL